MKLINLYLFICIMVILGCGINKVGLPPSVTPNYILTNDDMQNFILFNSLDITLITTEGE